MSSFNMHRLRMEALREAKTSPSFSLFSHGRSKSMSQSYQAANDLEGQPLKPAQTAPNPPTSSGSDGNETQVGAPGVDAEKETEPTATQGVMRQRTLVGTSREQSSSSDDTAKSAPEPEEKKKKDHTFFKHLTPSEPFTPRNQIMRIVCHSWLNLLVFAAPVGIILNYIHSVNRIAVFVVNFIAILPLAGLLGFATEEIAMRTGETVGGLLNASFGNAVELIIAIIALAHKEVVIVQTSLIGSILSNLLLVLGMCFFAGGLTRPEQYFNTVVAQTSASLLALAVAAVIVPTVFDIASDTPQSDVAKLSRGTAVILLVVYGAYLFFQLGTHSTVFAEVSQKVEAKPLTNPLRNRRGGGSDLKEGAIAQGLVRPAGLAGGHGLPSSRSDNEKVRSLLTHPPQGSLEADGDSKPDNDDEDPKLHFAVALGTLAVVTVLIALCAEFMVDGISAVTAGGGISAEFVGLILLPIVGNAAEHVTAITVACKDKMDLAIGVAVGSSMQVALFIIPLLVIIGWGMGMDEMALSFDPFQVAVLFVAVLLVNYLIADGKSHWLEGMLLMCLYAIIAVCSWWYPAISPEVANGGE